MKEAHPVGFQFQAKEIVFPQRILKELSEIIPTPDQFHYVLTGDNKQNRDMYQVSEGDNIKSVYMFPAKSDMTKPQLVNRKTFAEEAGLFGGISEKKVEFDRKTGKWKKLNVFQQVKRIFNKPEPIPAQVTDGVLHTLEPKRPVGVTVKEVNISTVKDAQVDLGLKYKYVERTLVSLKKEVAAEQQKNKKLKLSLGLYQAKVIDLARRLGYSRQEAQRLAYELDAAHQKDASYTGPVYSRSDMSNVVEGQVI